MEKYLKIKCKECNKKKLTKEEDVPRKFSFRDMEKEIDEENFICDKCKKEIESKRMNHCNYCDKDVKPTHEHEYTNICGGCYSFIMNEYEPKGIIKEIFEVTPNDDGFIEWDNIAEMKYDIYKILKDKEK